MTYFQTCEVIDVIKVKDSAKLEAEHSGNK